MSQPLWECPQKWFIDIGSKTNNLFLFLLNLPKDEADVLLVLEKKPYEDFLEFEQENQKIKFVVGKPRKPQLEPFRDEANYFNHQLYFFTFMQLIFNIISSQGQNLPSKLKLSMNPLSTFFVPCKTCMKRELFQPYPKRCRHHPGCKLDGKKHREDCGCQNFTSPSLTYSKIGNTENIPAQPTFYIGNCSHIRFVFDQ